MSGQPIYLLQVGTFDRSKQRGFYFPEREHDQLTKAAVIRDIESGEYTEVERVIAVDMPAGTARDATREVAHEILARLDEPPPPFLQDFLESVLGCGLVANVLREMEAA